MTLTLQSVIEFLHPSLKTKLKDMFLNAVRSFMEMETLTAPLAKELIDHIDVYESEARLLIDQYIYFYNNQRIQLKTKLTPLEKRSQFVA